MNGSATLITPIIFIIKWETLDLCLVFIVAFQCSGIYRRRVIIESLRKNAYFIPTSVFFSIATRDLSVVLHHSIPYHVCVLFTIFRRSVCR